jgi:signal transduction histidine kinase/CheY-like chemotaxis protein
MTLRARIFLFLGLFAVVPLLLAVAINLPLVLERVELFYRHAFLQDLRADFRDLDQHLASRHEMVRLLAKLPEPGVVVGEVANVDEQAIDASRARYTEWINRILAEQFDITEISFLDTEGKLRFWLERDPDDGAWYPTLSPPPRPPEELLAAVLAAKGPAVFPTPVRVDPEAAYPGRVLSLQLLSPIGPNDAGEAIGVVAMTVDIGGLARRDPEALWVRDDGSYLHIPGLPERRGSAFDDFPGLREKFAEGKIALWEGGGRQAVWVPLLRTSDDRPLWVARRVNREPLDTFQDAIIFRVLGIVLVLFVFMLLAARWFAARAESFGRRMLDGITGMLQRDEPVVFNWRGARELVQLGDSLTQLSEAHARNSRNLRAHARELEQSNRYKSEFLANVSHELRTPLNSIVLLSKMLAEGECGDGEEARQRARVIHEASKDLRALIDNILDLSRIESGKLVLDVAEVDLRALLDDLVELLGPQFAERGLYLRLEVAPAAAARVRTDGDKVKQILSNFLANAVKFTAQGGVRLCLAAAAEPYAVRISVVDSGMGIPADKHETIFEAFKQADGSTSRRYGGTGLGLTISRELAELIGGEITLSSTPGEGADFALLLPRDCHCGPGEAETQRPAGRSVTVVEPEPEAQEPSADFARQRVLVVDHDVRRLLTLTPRLEGWGLEVLAAGDAEEALESLEDDVALVIAGPDVSASEPYATIRRMRQDPRMQALPVIALCDPGAADAAPDSTQRLALPVDWHALRALLETHLSEPAS